MSSQENQPFNALRIFFTGVGGQGTLLATRFVGEAALEAGLPVTMSEIHGMAQRGGVVESSVVMGRASSPTIADGEADIVLAFEPLEAVRALPKCSAQSLIVSNTVAVAPFTVAIGQAEYPEHETLYRLIREHVPNLVLVDAVALAREAGSDRAANIAMVGVMAGLGRLPIADECWKAGLKTILPARLLEVNQRAFELGYKAGAQAS